LPSKLISQLGLKWRRRAEAVLADGSKTSFDVFVGAVLWDGHRRRIPVDASDDVPLVGMSLLSNQVLTVEVWSAGAVIIRDRR